MAEVEASVPRRQNTATQYIMTQPIINLCDEALQWLGTRVSKRRWEQEGLDLVGVCVEVALALALAAALEGEP